MRRESDGSFKVGDMLYDVGRSSDDGKLHLWKTQLVDIVVTYTPTGRPRKPIFKGHAVNYSTGADKKRDIEVDPGSHYTSATNAVSASLRYYFDKKCGRNDISAEERLLKAIFDEEPDPRVAATELVDVIYDLKNYHALFAEAFAEDDKQVQKIEVSDGQHGKADADAVGAEHELHDDVQPGGVGEVDVRTQHADDAQTA